jgi:hypothetical protein
MNLYKFETIKKIEIDCTSYCNAFCGACDRNIDGGENHPNLKLNHIDLENWRKFITKENLQYINEIIFNGNFGDFSMHPHFIEMMEILASVKTDVYLNLNTNGGARNTEFWHNLAVVLQKFTKHDIKWGIDGLEETHDLYRRGIDWTKRIDNLCAFTNAGGNAIWKCIVFDYNKDHLDEISEFAKQCGCMAFQTNRNRSQPLKMKAYKDFPEQSLTSPDLKTFNEMYKRKDTFKKQVATPKTTAQEPQGFFSCPYAEEGMIQIDPWGQIWPCCYISGRQIDMRTNFNFSKYKNNTLDHSLKETIEIIQNDLSLAWKRESIDICNKCAGKDIPAPKYGVQIG